MRSVCVSVQRDQQFLFLDSKEYVCVLAKAKVSRLLSSICRSAGWFVFPLLGRSLNQKQI